MSHMINTKKDTGYTANTIPNRRPNWHGLFPHLEVAPRTWQEALVAAKLDKPIIEEGVRDIHGNRVAGYKLLRDTYNNDVVHIAKHKYTVFQNDVVLETAQSLVDARGEGIDFASAGTVKDRKIVFATLALPEYLLAGDVMKPFLNILNSHDGTYALTICCSDTRSECWNTIQMALKDAQRVFRARHTGNVKERMEEARRILGLHEQYELEFRKAAEFLLRTKMAEPKWNGLLDYLMPLPIDSEATKRKITHVEERRAILTGELQRADLENFRWTGWGFLNAVSGYASHAPLSRQSDSGLQNRFLEVTVGDPMLNKTLSWIKAQVLDTRAKAGAGLKG